MLGQDLAIGGAGELAAAIGVEDEGASGSALGEGHAQGRADQWCIEDGAHGPANDASAKDIEHGDQIEPALAAEHAGGITAPELIGPSILGALPGEDPL